MDPINYSAMQVQPDFLKDVAGGFSLVQGIKQAQLQQQMQKDAIAQQQQYRNDISSYLANPTAQGASALTLKYPQQREAFKQSWDQMNEADRTDQSKAGTQIYGALLSGRPDLAQNILQNRITARSNSGLDTSQEAGLLDMLKSDPQKAQGAIGLWLAHTSDPKTFASTFGSLGQENRAQENAPATAVKNRADAAVAAAQAANIDTKIGQENTMGQEKINTERFNRDIASLDAQIKAANSETDRGRLQLQRDEYIAKYNQQQQDQGSAATAQLDSINNGLDTVKNILTHPGLSSIGSGVGKLWAMLPGTDAKDIRSMVDTLKSQQFLSAAKDMKGMGALSDAEGARIERAIASLDTDQSVSAFKNALGVIQTTMEKGRSRLVNSGKLPTSGGAYIGSSPKYGNVFEGQVNQLLKSYPGATRDDVMRFLGVGGK